MPLSSFPKHELTFKPLTLREWQDFTQLFEEHGPQNGCWCMYWRTSRAECQRGFGEGNKRAFRAIIESGKVPGILAYDSGRPIAWCSIAPREDYPVLDRSRTLKRVDDEPVWSIACFFVSKGYRRRGITEVLIGAAIDYARRQGAEIVEAYPLRTQITKMLPYERYMGIQSTFERVGFKEVAMRSERRPILRYYIRDRRGAARSDGGSTR
jgi:GNAT superfamily N-acetyltransferase